MIVASMLALSSSSAAEVSVRMEPTGPVVVPQGAPMPYRATSTNAAADERAASLTFTPPALGRRLGGGPVP